MRHIQVEDGLRLRFPNRGEEFTEGVEIGLLLGRMAAGQREFTAYLASSTLEQARAIATRMNYRVHVVSDDEGASEVMFLTGSRRPKLSLLVGKGEHLPVRRA